MSRITISIIASLIFVSTTFAHSAQPAGSAENPRQITADDKTERGEILVEKVKAMRYAERDGQVDTILGYLVNH